MSILKHSFWRLAFYLQCLLLLALLLFVLWHLKNRNCIWTLSLKELHCSYITKISKRKQCIAITVFVHLVQNSTAARSTLGWCIGTKLKWRPLPANMIKHMARGVLLAFMLRIAYLDWAHISTWMTVRFGLDAVIF